MRKRTSFERKPWTYDQLVSKGVTANGAHQRVKRLWGSASQYACVDCAGTAAQWAYDGTDPTHLYGPPHPGRSWMYYSAWPEFYMPMCTRCHSARDRQLAAQELREYREWKIAHPGMTLEDVA